jgi:parallel beta-helix repeat protein
MKQSHGLQITFKIIAIFMIVTLALAALPVLPARAAVFTSAQSGNWNSGSTWVGGIAPFAGDSVVIAAGHNVSTNGNRTCAGITITGTLSMSSGNTLTVNGDVSGGGTWSTGNSLSTRTISFTGNWSFNGTSTGDRATAEFSGTGAQTFTGVYFTGLYSTGGGTLLMSKTGGTATLLGNVTGPNLTLNGIGGTLNLGTGLTHVFWTLTRTNGILEGGSSMLKLGNSPQGSGGTFTAGTGTVEYNGTTTTIAAVAYNNLIFSNSGSKIMPAGTSVTGNLSITGSARASVASGQNLSVASLTLGTLGTANDTWGSGPATPPTYKTSTYFANSTGYLTVGTDTRAAQAALTVTGPASITYGSSPSITSTGGSGTGAKSYSAGASTDCSVAPATGVVTIIQVGASCSVTVTKAADGNFLSTTTGAWPITLNKATPVLTFDPAPAVSYPPAGTFTVNATSTNTDLPLAITYSKVSGPCTWSSGATFNYTAVGTCVVQADEIATTNFNAAAPVTDDVIITSSTVDVTTNPATAVKRTGATLNGTVTPGIYTITVTFEWGLTTAYGNTVTATQSPVPPGALPVAVSFPLNGLVPNTTYHYRVVGTRAGPVTSNGLDAQFHTALAGSTTYYVDNTVACSDAGPGSTLNPFCTIGRGATLADAGDTVRVLHGTYAETVKPTANGGSGMPITFSAAPGVTVTGLVGNSTNGGGFRFFSKTYIVVDGFTINNTADYGVILTSCNHITISNNHVSHAGTVNTIFRHGIYLIGTTNSLIQGNTTDYNTMDGIMLLNGSDNNEVSNNISFGNAGWNPPAAGNRDAKGIEVWSSDFNLVLHNITYANEDTGLNFYSSSNHNLVIGNLSYSNGDHGMDHNNAPNNIITGNTIFGNVTSGINLEAGSLGATVVNNIVMDNGVNPPDDPGPTPRKAYNIFVDSTSTAGTTLDYNLYYLSPTLPAKQVWWNTTGYATLLAFQGPGREPKGLEANPLFVAPAPRAVFPITVVAGDYHLLAGSPAVDSAYSDASNEPLLDLDGNPRVDMIAVPNTGTGSRLYDDRGAYEFQPLAQAIIFTSTAPVGAVVGGPTYTPTATGGGSGNPVVFSIDAASTVCTISAGVVYFIGNGTCIVDANQAGNATYNPAPQVQQSFGVGKADQTITFTSTAPTNAVAGGATYTSTATATSGLVVSLTIDASASTVCTISTGVVSFIGTGSCKVNANQAGNGIYNPAPQVQQSFAVSTTFGDVPVDYTVMLGTTPYNLHGYIQRLYMEGFTAGCQASPLLYCPDATMTRAESAVFMLRGLLGAGYTPPLAPWDTFVDPSDNWAAGTWAQKWAQGMWDEGLTAGCQTPTLPPAPPAPLRFCPWDNFPRVQAAVFALKISHGNSYVPPPATGTVFADMTDTVFYGTKWAEQAYAEGLIPACTTTPTVNFCPNDLMTRAWGAYVIVKAKGLTPTIP